MTARTTFKAIWYLFVVTNVLYGVVLSVILPGGLATPFPSEHPLLVPLMVISSLALAISMVLPKALFLRAKHALDQAGPSPSEGKLYAAFFPPWIVRMVFLQTIAIYGIFLAIRSGALVAYLPFGFLAVVTQLSHYPSLVRIRELLGYTKTH